MDKLGVLRGAVARFNGKGRRLGYPTANIRIDTVLNDGIYFGFADLTEYHKYLALIFIGTPTTVGNSGRRVEAHLLDIADKDYYGQQLSLTILKFHRPSKTFANIEELKAAMKDDEAAARKWFKKHGN